jgi:radical SAM superfamily enzyme YgiQ (UPF0313 family)
MKRIRAIAQPDHIWFCDDIFGLTPGWVEEFSDVVTREHAVIPFKCLGRVDLLLKGETIHHLRNAGCSAVWVGAESGSQKILDAMEKGTTVAQIYDATRRLKQAGIRVGFFLQFGYPGESREDIALTWTMVKECQPDDIGISVSYPLPGTRFYDSVREQLGSKQNWLDSQDLAMLFRGSFAPEFYRSLHRVTHKRFRLWQGMGEMRAVARRPWQLSPEKARRIAAALYHAITLPRAESHLDALAMDNPSLTTGAS